MSDRGWIFDPDERRWELRGPDWDTVHGVITAEFVQRGGEQMTVRVCTRNGWPPLRAGRPWWHCVLSGGPFDGLHEWLDPDGYREPPPALFQHAGQFIEVSVAGGGMPLFIEEVPPVVYRRQIQVCGHGRACGYPYTFDAPRSPYPDTCRQEAGR